MPFFPLTYLSKISDLRVISRTTVMKYKNTDLSIPEIGKELGVQSILEGSVRRSGNRIRIVSQLIDARKDEPIWSETFDRNMDDIFEIQTEVARNIAASLKAELTEEEEKLIKEVPTESTEAYALYLLGNIITIILLRITKKQSNILKNVCQLILLTR